MDTQKACYLTLNRISGNHIHTLGRQGPLPSIGKNPEEIGLMFLIPSNETCAPCYNKKGSKMNSPQVPISWGELFDKITILQIKLENLTSKNAFENVGQKLKKRYKVFRKCGS